MSHNISTEALNKLHSVLGSSFPLYLRYARPWTQPGDADAMETFAQIADDIDAMCGRVQEAIVQRRGVVEPIDFPMEFTDRHDLGLGYIIPLTIAYLQQDIEQLQECVEQLTLSPDAKDLAEESLGLVRGHLDLLSQLEKRPVAC